MRGMISGRKSCVYEIVSPQPLLLRIAVATSERERDKRQLNRGVATAAPSKKARIPREKSSLANR